LFANGSAIGKFGRSISSLAKQLFEENEKSQQIKGLATGTYAVAKAAVIFPYTNRKE
jgi:hypothetical protein